MSVPPTNAEADSAVPAAGVPNRALTNAILKDLISTDALKAPLAGPTFTGTPAAPTAVAATNTTQLATTAHVFAERTNTATLTNKTLTAPGFTGLETHAGTDLFTAAAMGANQIDTTKARNTKTLSADTTFTYSAAPSDGGEFGLELTGHTAVTTVTLPANAIDASRQVAVTTFVMPANFKAFLQFRLVGSNYYVFGIPTPNIQVFSRTNLAGDDTYEGEVVGGLLAGATIAQWEAVYLGASSTWLLADANGSGTFPCRGLAVAAYVSTNPALIIDKGVVRNDAWAWTPGGDVYLSTTAGGLTQTAPSTSGDKVQKIGYALDADSIYVNIGSGEYLTVT